MEMLWHLVLESEGRQALFHEEAELCNAVRALAAIAGTEVLLFCVVDEHVHIVAFCTRERAGRLAQQLKLAFRVRCRVPLRHPTFIEPVESRIHLERLVAYVLRQPSHHDLPVHPALWTGSCFLDLVGARSIGALGQRIDKFLQRFRVSAALAYVGLSGDRVVPAGDDQLRCAGAVRLAAAARAALAVGPGAPAKWPEACAVRNAVCFLARTAGFSTNDTAAAVGTSRRTVQLLARKVPPPALVRAVRVRLALEDMVSQRAGIRPGPCGRGESEAGPTRSDVSATW